MSYVEEARCLKVKGTPTFGARNSKRKFTKRKGRSKTDHDKTAAHMTSHGGDKVLFYDESVRRGRSRKLIAQWVGPCAVLAVDGVNVTIRKVRNTVKFNVNRLKHFL